MSGNPERKQYFWSWNCRSRTVTLTVEEKKLRLFTKWKWCKNVANESVAPWQTKERVLKIHVRTQNDILPHYGQRVHILCCWILSLTSKAPSFGWRLEGFQELPCVLALDSDCGDKQPHGLSIYKFLTVFALWGSHSDSRPCLWKQGSLFCLEILLNATLGEEISKSQETFQ